MSTWTPTSGGCGCGGRCASPSAGAAPSTGTAAPSAYIRPRFFGGMLLTEDDLQAIDDYTVAKRRLTNRHLFGAGVVCGLDVDCDPCKPGWLTVTPGYALDCCGNDIVVGCPVRIDALALLSDLRRSSPVDCGEPCDGRPARDYTLVVSYDEQPTDAVAPYARDDCAVGDCDFSRVREGYRFELVCDPAAREPSLFDRLRECARNAGEQTREDTAALIRMAELATVQTRVREAVDAGAVPAAAPPTAKDFDTAEARGVAPSIALLARAAATLAAPGALNPSTRRMQIGRAHV